MKNIPDLIKTEFRLTNSQIARLSRDVAGLQRDVGELRRPACKVECAAEGGARRCSPSATGGADLRD